MFITKLWLFFAFSSLSVSQKDFYPNLPMGEYRVIYEAVRGCPNSKNHAIKFYVHFNKKSINTTEIRGNITCLVPVDDNLVLDSNVSSWSLTGGWAENAGVLRMENFCTNLKLIAGQAWSPVLDAFHFPTKNCPLPKGKYTTSGFDVRILDGNSLPKVFFYGKYKLTIKAKYKNNTLVGCASLEFKLVRPWEAPKK